MHTEDEGLAPQKRKRKRGPKPKSECLAAAMSKLNDLSARFEGQQVELENAKEKNLKAIVTIKKLLKDLEDYDLELTALRNVNNKMKHQFHKAMKQLEKYKSAGAASLDGT